MNLNLDISDNFTIYDDPYKIKWPIDRETHVSAMSELAEFYTKFLLINPVSFPTAIEIFHGYILSQLASIFQAERLNKFPIDKTSIPSHAHFWKLVFCDIKIPYRFSSQLQSGLSAPSIRKNLRVFKPRVLNNGLKNCRLNAHIFKNEIISTSGVNPLIIANASLQDLQVNVCPLSEWFAPLDQKTITSICQNDDDKHHIWLFLRLVSEIFRGYGVEMGTTSSEYLEEWLTITSSYVRAHYQRLINHPKYLPKELWTNSLGIPWNSILARAVRENGGTVVVHDHALGANAMLPQLTCFVEFQQCDEFVTYSPAIRDIVKGTRLAKIVCEKRKIIFSDVDASKFINTKKKKSFLSLSVSKKLNKRVMFVQSMFMTDVSELNPLMPDNVAANWQIRLFKFLKLNGFEVIIKPHPLTKTNINKKILNEIGLTIVTKPFEDVYEGADILLFDAPVSTTFGTALRSKKPIVLVDFGYISLPERFMEFLDTRICRVKGWYNASNHADVDWLELGSVLTAPSKPYETRFVDNVLGG